MALLKCRRRCLCPIKFIYGESYRGKCFSGKLFSEVQMASFDELGINKRLCRAVAEMGWTEPTPIQLLSIPEGMAGRDVLGQAQTGTGKTGA